MDSNQTAVLVDAKRMYTAQLCDSLYPTILSIFESMFSACLNQKKPLVAFQTRLKEAPVWNNSVIKKYTDMLTSKCPWLSELLAAVFVSHVKVLTSIRLNSNKPHIKLKIPSNETYVHAVLVDVAQELYQNPYLMQQQDAKGTAAKKEIICRCLDNNVRNLLPIKDILVAYMGQSVNNNEIQPDNIGAAASEASSDDQSGDDEAKSSASDGIISNAASHEAQGQVQQPEPAAPAYQPPPVYPLPVAPPAPYVPQPVQQPPPVAPDQWTQPQAEPQPPPASDEHRTVPLQAKPRPLYDDAADELE